MLPEAWHPLLVAQEDWIIGFTSEAKDFATLQSVVKLLVLLLQAKITTTSTVNDATSFFIAPGFRLTYCFRRDVISGCIKQYGILRVIRIDHYNPPFEDSIFTHRECLFENIIGISGIKIAGHI